MFIHGEVMRDTEVSREWLVEAVQRSLDAIICADDEQKIVFFNHGAEEIFGYSAEEALGRPLSMLIPARFRVEHGAHAKELGSSGGASRIMQEQGEVSGLRSSGEEFPAEASIAKTTVEGRIIYAVVLRDVTERHEKRRLQAEADHRWHVLADELPLLLSYVDRDERYQFANRAYGKLLGIRPSEIVGMHVKDVLGEETYRGVEDAIRAVLGGSAVRFEAQPRSASGEVRVADVTYRPDIGPEGDVRGFYVAVLDVTERKRVEEALARRESVVRALYEIASESDLALGDKVEAYLELGCRVFDLDQGILSRVTGDRYEVLHAFPESDTVRRGSVFELNHTYCSKTLRAATAVGFARATGSDWETHPCYGSRRLEAYLGAPVVVRDDVVGTLNFSSLQPRGRPIRDAERDLVRLMALWIGNELHREERLEAESILAETGRVASTSLNQEEIAEGLVRVVAELLGGACAIFEASGGGHPRLLAAASDGSAWDAGLRSRLGQALVRTTAFGMRAAISSGEPQVDTITDDVLRPEDWSGTGVADGLSDVDAEFGPRSTMAIPLLDAGEYLGIMLLGSPQPGRFNERDLLWARPLAGRISATLERARAHAAVRDAVQRRDQILAFVAHDLGGPLSAISMVTEHVLGHHVGDLQQDEVRAHLEDVRSAAGRMENLIQDLLDRQLLMEGRLQLHSVEMRAADLLVEAKQAVETRSDGQLLSIEWEAVGDPTVHVDRLRVLRVLANLLDNAVKFTAKEGRITLRAESRDGYVLFAVSDTGRGIEPDRLPTLFDRFARPEYEGGGSGLGLDIARQIVEAHGGAIWAESELGIGSTFSFTLPRGASDVRRDSGVV
jgi:PAS domain S-box-containing protein